MVSIRFQSMDWSFELFDFFLLWIWVEIIFFRCTHIQIEIPIRYMISFVSVLDLMVFCRHGKCSQSIPEQWSRYYLIKSAFSRISFLKSDPFLWLLKMLEKLYPKDKWPHPIYSVTRSWVNEYINLWVIQFPSARICIVIILPKMEKKTKCTPTLFIHSSYVHYIVYTLTHGDGGYCVLGMPYAASHMPHSAFSYYYYYSNYTHMETKYTPHTIFSPSAAYLFFVLYIQYRFVHRLHDLIKINEKTNDSCNYKHATTF